MFQPHLCEGVWSCLAVAAYTFATDFKKHDLYTAGYIEKEAVNV